MPAGHVNGAELYWERRGAGPRLLFCNGSGTTLQAVRPLLDVVAARFDLLAWDYRGLGGSVPLTGRYTMADLAADAVGLLEITGWDVCRVLGVSFGGMVAQEFAVTSPERVERLALACTSAGGDGGSSYPLHTLQQLPPEERAAAHLKLADSRWTSAGLRHTRQIARWPKAWPPLARISGTQPTQPPAQPSSRRAQAMTSGTASARSPARPWSATATTTRSHRLKTAPRSHRTSAEPSCAATKEDTCSCSRTRPRYRNSRHSCKHRRGSP
jgi:pimeloyl-ACP methyl ester carboxylesterase